MNQLFKRLSASQKIVSIFALILAGVLLLNVAVSLIPKEWDTFVIDPIGTFTPGERSKALVKKLDTDVTIYCVRESDTSYQNPNAAPFQVMLHKYARISKHLNVEFVDAADTEFLSKYNAVGLSDLGLIIESSERYTILPYGVFYEYAFPENNVMLSYEQMLTLTDAWYGLVEEYASTYGEEIAISYADAMIEQYSGIKNFYAGYLELTYGNNLYWCADAMIASAIDYVTTQNIPTTYILAGHNEAELSATFLSKYLDRYGVAYSLINLASTQSIPDNAAALVLNDPQTDITESEKALIADFIAKGGSFILNTTPEAADLPNLMALLGAYGLSAQNAIVLDDTLTYNVYLSEDQTTEAPEEKSTESESESETEAETETETKTETETETESGTESDSEASTYPKDYLFLLPDTNHALSQTASEVILSAVLEDLQANYLEAVELYQSTGNSMYQAYAQYWQQIYQSYIQQDRDFQMLIAGAHPITYTETPGVSVKPLFTTSANGYLSTDSTPGTYNMAITATVTTNSNAGCIVWFGCADSYTKDVEDVYPYNSGYLFSAIDYAGGTQMFNSEYASIASIDLGSSLDLEGINWLIVLMVVAAIALPLAAVISGIVICVVRKRK